MSESLQRALARVRGQILDEHTLVRAVASGRRKGERPRWRRAELRYVDLKGGRQLQVVTYDDTRAFTQNHLPGTPARDAVDILLDEPFGNWYVETTTETHQLRVTKKLEAVMHTAVRADPETRPVRSHDRAKPRLLPEDHPVLVALGISDAVGRVKPTRQAKYRQVEEFLRLLDQSISAAIEGHLLRQPTAEDPLRVVDLGCGNAYLTFAAHAYLTERGIPVQLTGVDTKVQALEHGQHLADELRLGGVAGATFVRGGISDAVVDPAPEVVLALHACDTATDDALARAVAWQAALVLAAPCCHHDIAAQLRRTATPAPYSMLTRDGILRERLADTLTDALRAALLRLHGYRVDVVEFVGSAHTPRNTLIRALRTGAEPTSTARQELDALTGTWRVTPRLAELLGRAGQ
ncbi:MAG: SAM-dependent methyltransferase [Actinomycetota bacterium]|nr:SAM-dependent methyltransferase [Actinomycetota bacterium]